MAVKKPPMCIPQYFLSGRFAGLMEMIVEYTNSRKKRWNFLKDIGRSAQAISTSCVSLRKLPIPYSPQGNLGW
jgi:hypothetical protein